MTVEERYPSNRGVYIPCGDVDFSEAGPDGVILTVHARTHLVVTRAADWAPHAP
ncbi:hypothetical protein BH11MYX2_BH11MYX2_38840 [soil metagenome]